MCTPTIVSVKEWKIMMDDEPGARECPPIAIINAISGALRFSRLPQRLHYYYRLEIRISVE